MQHFSFKERGSGSCRGRGEPVGAPVLERVDGVDLAQAQSDVVEPFEEALAGAVVEREVALDVGGRRRQRAPLDVDGDL
jgi:hypothetical protein